MDAGASLNNAECSRLAMVIETSEDREMTLKVLRAGGKKLIMAVIELSQEE